MTVDLKTKIGIAATALLVAFASGRYSVSTPQVHTVEDQKTDSDIKKNQDTHKKTQITETKEPDGKVVTVTSISEDTEVKSNTDMDVQTHLDQTITPPKKNTVNLSALVGVDVTKSFTPVYGVSVTDNIIGPISVGAWGFTNGMAGVSLGISF